MKVSIIILTHNQLEYTKKCIESIREKTNIDYELIVVDNASSDDTINYLEKQQDIKLVKNNENLGYAKGNNQGFKLVTGDVVVFLNNDVVVTFGWLESLVETLFSEDNIGMVGPVTNNISGLQRINVTYDQESTMGLEEFSEKHREKYSGQKRKVLRLVGFALACKKTVLDEIGLFDEKFGLGNYEDDDLCLRTLKNGYKLFIAEESFVHHFGSITFKNSKVNYSDLMIENSSKLYNKWGFNVNYFMHPRLEVANIVPNNVKRVLEIGCGMGAMAIELKKKNNCEVVGVELDEKVAQFATFNLDKVYCGDIEMLDVSIFGKFDCIICADVLEHLKDPWNTVKKIGSLLKDDGYFVVSIPNVANLEVIQSLIQGDFTYRDAGILDKTHLRFFTRQTLPSLFPDEIEIKALHSITLNYDESEKMFVEYLGRLGKKFNLDTDFIETDILTYQFLLIAQKQTENKIAIV